MSRGEETCVGKSGRAPAHVDTSLGIQEDDEFVIRSPIRTLDARGESATGRALAITDNTPPSPQLVSTVYLRWVSVHLAKRENRPIEAWHCPHPYFPDAGSDMHVKLPCLY